jgi:two-component system, cell cycle sensor histidine kinase and response regulator CckA
MTPESPLDAVANVLVVDDEEAIRHVVRYILEKRDYHVTEAGSGREAIALIDGGAPIDLLMADLAMPEMGGDEMARRIRATRPDLKVLYVTGHIGQLMDERPLLWQGEAFLEKPFSAAGLLEAVSLILYGTVKRPS